MCPSGVCVSLGVWFYICLSVSSCMCVFLSLPFVHSSVCPASPSTQHFISFFLSFFFPFVSPSLPLSLFPSCPFSLSHLFSSFLFGFFSALILLAFHQDRKFSNECFTIGFLRRGFSLEGISGFCIFLARGVERRRRGKHQTLRAPFLAPPFRPERRRC